MGRKKMYGRGFPNCASMGEPKVKQEREIKASVGRTVRFRVASANSGRVLTEVFKDETASWCGSSVCGSVDSDCSSGLPEAAERDSDTNSHLHGLVAGTTLDESGCEPDDLLLYAASANKRELRFSNKRVNICSKNGTIRGVRNKVSAGQVLFNNLSNLPNMYTVNLRSNKNHQKKRPWEKD